MRSKSHHRLRHNSRARLPLAPRWGYPADQAERRVCCAWRRRNQCQFAIADKNRGRDAAFDRRAEIKFSTAQGKDRGVAGEHQIGYGGEWPAEILGVLSDLS